MHLAWCYLRSCALLRISETLAKTCLFLLALESSVWLLCITTMLSSQYVDDRAWTRYETVRLTQSKPKTLGRAWKACKWWIIQREVLLTLGLSVNLSMVIFGTLEHVNGALLILTLISAWRAVGSNLYQKTWDRYRCVGKRQGYDPVEAELTITLSFSHVIFANATSTTEIDLIFFDRVGSTAKLADHMCFRIDFDLIENRSSCHFCDRDS
jgi:hypothetical protein